MEPSDTHPAARLLDETVGRRHRIDLPRDWRRRAIPSRSARPADVHIAAAPGGYWLDIVGRAGVLFTAEEWLALLIEAGLLLLEDPAVAEILDGGLEPIELLKAALGG